MTQTASNATWMLEKDQIILISNTSQQNFILELPTGRYRLDAGRQMRTVRSILDNAQVKQLVNNGQLVIQKP